MLSIETHRPGSPAPEARFALWRLGFRPFYLAAALFAALAVPLWIAVYAGALSLPRGLPPHLWHAHEMVFGFGLAVVSGFLFTAVRNWTERPTPTGPGLAGLVTLWAVVRVGWLTWPPALALAFEALFLLLMAVSLLRALVRARNRRNYFVGALFLVLALVDLLFYLGLTGRLDVLQPEQALRLALYLVVVLTFVIGGRVIPMFTLNAVRGLRQYRDARLDRAALAASLLAFGLDVAGARGGLVALAALVAGGLHAARLAGWRPLATRGRPILWILHLSYAWACAGFALMAAAALGWVPAALAVHAFSLGTVGGLVIGMITRTALGHTGRMLVAGRAEVAMYVLVQAAAAVRVAGPLLVPALYLPSLVLATTLWSAAFLLYLVVYGPRLTQPRVDGRDG